MTKKHGDAAKIAAGIQKHLDDDSQGRRSVRWLAQKSGIAYSTLQGKLTRAPGLLNVGELFSIADALDCDIRDLCEEVAA